MSIYGLLYQDSHLLFVYLVICLRILPWYITIKPPFEEHVFMFSNHLSASAASRQACQPLQLPLGIRIHHSHDITRLPSGGQSCRLCGAVVRRNTKRLQVPCRKLAVANRHGQVLGGKKHLSISKIVFCNLCTWIV